MMTSPLGAEEATVAGLREWREREGYIALVVAAIFSAVVIPSFHFTLMRIPNPPPDSLGIRLWTAGFSLAVLAVIWLVPLARKSAYRFHALFAVVIMSQSAAQMAFDGDYALLVGSALLIVLGLAMIFVDVWQILASNAIAFAFHIVYSTVHFGVDPVNTNVLFLYGIAHVWACVFGFLFIRSREREVRARLRSEELQGDREAFLRAYDPVTELRNRHALLEYLSPHPGRFAVVTLHVDHPDPALHRDPPRFAQILGAVARRLRTSSPATAEVFRGAGDTLVTIERGIAPGESADRVATRVLESMAAPLDDVSPGFFARLSVAHGVYPDDAANLEDLLEALEASFGERGSYVAKLRGSAPRDIAHDIERMQRLTVDLHEVVGRGELRLDYQPFISADGAVLGTEALVRWHHPELGVLPPGGFLHFPEQSDLIVPVGDWVVRESARRAAAWQYDGIDLIVSFNVSGKQFSDVSLHARLQSALGEAKVLATHLEMEITETMVMEDPIEARQTLMRCKAIGFGVALDDFGTGYSSLSSLSSLPVDVVKIDRSFVAGLPDQQESCEIARAIIVLGHTLGRKVCAEGAEDERQLRWLVAAGCDRLQGFWIGRPMAANSVPAWIDS
jgi:EAL domain-containing protein (putative c-di-GMP-specific phosphodiesterase class I)/GGDEF domain-containing protein